MDRKDAVVYLSKKEKLKEPYTEREFSIEEEALIEKVEREGKIFGDPMVELK